MGARDKLKGAKSREELLGETTIIETPTAPVVTTPKIEVAPKTKSLPNEADDSVPVYVRRVKRPELSAEHYGYSPFTSTLNLYNRDLIRWVSDFSRENKLNGGKPLNKSTMIEAILDFVMYDMGLQPDGFQDANELREQLRSKLK